MTRKESSMSIFNSPQKRSSAAALAVALAGLLWQTAEASNVRPPAVPATIQVPEGNKAFLEARGIGTQNYSCSPSGAGFAWILFTPEAVLLDDWGRQVTTHFFGPNPFEPNTDPTVTAQGTIRAVWRHSRDTSTVWARAARPPSFDPAFVRPNSVPWLLLEFAGSQDGPRGGDTLTPTTFIQRVNTSGGLAPSTGCAVAADVGKKAFVPYQADYVFFRKARSND
jgi:Protein of unknown function (DUF3455)